MSMGNFFTFHNVSINTSTPVKKKTVVSNFTFHNVSINTFLNSSPFRRITTLHSTMFLLIPNISHFRIFRDLTLHSTMFLLIRKPSYSISSFLCSLHSTMFLLILVKVLLVKSVTHFTFHNVSINTTHRNDV